LRYAVTLATIGVALLASSTAQALDKQGSAHGGTIEGGDTGFDVSGNVFFGSALYNPSYPARPDNTGLALFRFGAHADFDLIGRRLSIPLDVNILTDAERKGAGVFVPSEGDVIGGLTSTWLLGPGALEVGARFEQDMPLDRGGLIQRYGDARARYLYSIAEGLGLDDMTTGQDIRGYVVLGGFFYNSAYAARPDNTGLALFRYATHLDAVIVHWLSIGLDAAAFTDRQTKSIFRPSELDLTGDLTGHFGPFDVRLAYERDMPVDRGGLVQQLVYTTVTYSFDAELDKATHGGH